LVAQRLSIVVPALNEAPGIRASLEALAPLRARGHEVIVVDGGSDDATAQIASGLCDRVLVSPRGRARQMNAGARAASGDVLLFLHADTRLPPQFVIPEAALWGRFDVRIEGRHPLLKVIAWSMNLRSRLTGIATGDQAIFVRRDAFPGFAEIPLMEDVEFCRRMKRLAPPACRREKVLTSGRRWESRGVLRTVLLMWRLRLMYFCGAHPERLSRIYDHRVR
jgi:rSAM/selenodomain-associated transferase 2